MFRCVNPDIWNQLKFSTYRVSFPPLPPYIVVSFNLFPVGMSENLCVVFLDSLFTEDEGKIVFWPRKQVVSPTTVLWGCPTQLLPDQSQKFAMHKTISRNSLCTGRREVGKIFRVIAEAPNISTRLPLVRNAPLRAASSVFKIRETWSYNVEQTSPNVMVG